jgi:hypothetical protein
LCCIRLADLVSFYKQRLEQLGMKTPDVNSTRLKEKLLAEIPELESHKKGRGILLAFKKGAALSQASNYSEAIILAKAAKILRGHMIDKWGFVVFRMSVRCCLFPVLSIAIIL